MKKKIVIDTNVIITALRSRHGASNKLMQLFAQAKFINHISVALILEFEAVIKRYFPQFEEKEINYLLDYICAESKNTKIHYLWRPQLNDPADDMILELAVASSAEYIVTYNQRDFKNAEKFGVKVIAPKEMLELLGELS